MLLIVGTVPEDDFPLIIEQVALSKGNLLLGGREVEINRGTPALLAAAIRVSQALGTAPPLGCLIGDTGRGLGSKRLYSALSQQLPEIGPSCIAFHYLQPDVDGHNLVLLAIRELPARPIMIADAGFMYAAKMSGLAQEYDLFTPDVGELAFLADEEAPHPFYTRGFILKDEKKVPELIRRAYEHENAARYILVKGDVDFIASREGILSMIDRPDIQPMEAMGGSGDTITGIAAALVESSMEVQKAAEIAAMVNRRAAEIAQLSPASQVIKLIDCIPEALAAVKNEW